MHEASNAQIRLTLGASEGVRLALLAAFMASIIFGGVVLALLGYPMGPASGWDGR